MDEDLRDSSMIDPFVYKSTHQSGQLPEDPTPLGRIKASVWRAIRKSISHFLGLGVVATVIVILNILKPVVFSLAIDDGLIPGEWGTVFRSCSYLIVIASGLSICNVGHEVIASFISSRISLSIRSDAIEWIRNHNYTFFACFSSGDVLTRINDDTESIQNYVMTVTYSALTSFFGLVSAIAYMGVVQWRMVIVSFAVLPLMVIVAGRFKVILERAHRDLQSAKGASSTAMVSALEHMVYFRMSNQEVGAIGIIVRALERWRVASIRADKWSATSQAATHFVSSIGYTLILGYGGWLVVEDNLSLGHLLAFLTLRTHFMAPSTFVQQVYKGYYSMKPSLERLESVMAFAEEPSIRSPVGVRRGTSINEITLDRVTYCYERDQPVIASVVAKFGRGLTSIYGENGSGKTTIVRILTKLIEPSLGAVRVDGVDVRSVNSRIWRTFTSVLPQASYVVSGSLRDNLVAADVWTPDKVLVELLESVGFDMGELGRGLDSRIEEGGTNLSGGQIQSIALVRTLARDVPIYIFDEPFTHIDQDRKKLIALAMRRRTSDRIGIVITHDAIDSVHAYRIRDRRLVHEG